MSLNSDFNDDLELTRIRKEKLAKYMELTKLPKGIVNFDEDAFNKAINQSPIGILIDFYADWCHPCKAVAPIMAQLEKEYRGRLLFGKINTDNNQRVALTYRVMSIPTFIIFHNSKPIVRFVGALPKIKIKEHIEKALKIINKSN
ncbi:MAG: thioredoxin [Promethearchaeota archaeon]